MLGRPPYAQRQKQGVYRNPFAFPAGVAPALDVSHPAFVGVANGGFAAVAFGNGANFINLASGRTGTVTGSPTLSTTTLGPQIGFASGQSIKFSCKTIVSEFVHAAIVFTGSVTGVQSIQTSSSSSNTGVQIYANAGVVHVIFPGTFDFTSSITLSANTPYFIGATGRSNANSVFLVVTDLTTGTVKTQSFSTPSSINNGNGTGIIGNDVGGNFFAGKVACSAFGTKQVTPTQLRAWAADPWSFWYPDPIRLNYKGAAGYTGTGSGTLSKITGTPSLITGEGGGGITGEGGGTVLGEGSGGAVGVFGVTASSAGTLTKITGAASAKFGVTGTASGSLTRITGAASGTGTDTGSGTGTVSSITGTAAGTFGVVGTAAGTVSLITGAASGTSGSGEVSPPGEDEDHSQDPVPRIGGSGPKHVSGKPLGWRARRKKLLEEQRRAAELPEPVTGTAAGRLGGLSGAAAGAVGITGQAIASLPGMTGTADGFTWDSVGFDNDWLQLVA